MTISDEHEPLSLAYWLKAFAPRPEVNDRTRVVTLLKAIPEDKRHRALEKALSSVFGDDSPFDMPSNPDGKYVLEVLKSCGDEAEERLTSQHAAVIDVFLRELDLVKLDASNKRETADPLKSPTAVERPEVEEKSKPPEVAPPEVRPSSRSPAPQRPAPIEEESAQVRTDTKPFIATLTHDFVKPVVDDYVGHGTKLDDVIGDGKMSYLFQGLGADQMRIGSGELMRLPRILPPPPSEGAGEVYGKWLDGEIWHPQAVSFRLTLLESDLVDDLIEMQSEFFAMPAGACDTYGTRTPIDYEGASANDAAYALVCMGKDLGFKGWTHDAARDELARTIMRYLYEHEPVAADFLGRIGFEINVDIQLVAAVTAALDIEKFFIEDDAPAGASDGPDQDLRGTISHGCRLDRPVALESSVMSHFLTGKPIACGLIERLREIRHAQLCKYLGEDISTQEFDQRYDFDCFFELDEYFPERNPQADYAPV